MADLDRNSLDYRPGKSSAAVRAVVAVLAVVVIAFCGWSAATYAQGGDPLAFLNGDAFKTTASSTESDGSSATTKLRSTKRSVSVDDVKAALAKLEYGELDLALTSDQAGVVLADGTVWVENASTDAASTSIDTAAHRAAALAKWARKQKVGIKRIVWIQEDMAGNVRLALAYPVSRKSSDEYVEQILAGCTGYAISGDAYASLDRPAYAQESGAAPVLPDGSPVTVIAETTAAGEALTSDGQSYSVLSTGEVSTSGSSASGSASAGAASGSSSSSSTSGAKSSSGGSSSGSSSSSSGAVEQSGISVSVTVDASKVGAGSSSATVSLAAGSTVYDALKATGVSMNASNTQYGIYVSSIGGLAEKEHGATSGWMYSVNGTTPMTSCSNYKLSNGDKVVWYYVTGE